MCKAGATKTTLERVINEVRGGQQVQDANAEDQRQTLKKYCMDLTERARSGKLDPVIGRDEEIRRAIQVLQRRTKNNPVLIGEPGVGKTAIAEGLALRIANGDVPDGIKERGMDNQVPRRNYSKVLSDRKIGPSDFAVGDRGRYHVNKAFDR